MKIVLFISLTLLAFAATAQEKENSFLLIRGSLNNGNAKIDDNTRSYKVGGRLGYGLGVTYLKQIGNDEKLYLTLMPGINSRANKNVRAMYIDVPVTFGVALGEKKNLLLSAGGYAGVALGGSYKVIGSSRAKIKYGESLTDNRSRTDYGYVISFLNITELGVALGIDYFGGLKNVLPNARQAIDGSVKLNTVVFSMSVSLKAIVGE